MSSELFVSEEMDYFQEEEVVPLASICFYCKRVYSAKSKSKMVQCQNKHDTCFSTCHWKCFSMNRVEEEGGGWNCGHCEHLDDCIEGEFIEPPSHHAKTIKKQQVYQEIIEDVKKSKSKSIVILDGSTLSAFKCLKSSLPAKVQIHIPNASIKDCRKIRRVLSTKNEPSLHFYPHTRVGAFLRNAFKTGLDRCGVIWLDYCSTPMSRQHSSIEDMRAAIQCITTKEGYLHVTFSTRMKNNQFLMKTILDHMTSPSMCDYTNRRIRLIEERSHQYAYNMKSYCFHIQ